MRKDIKINVDTQTDGISLSSRRLGISSENLQGKIIFTPKPFIDGICRMYIEGHGTIEMDKQEDCYTLDIKSSLLITPSIDVCFKITEPEKENGVPIYATKIMHFEVLETIESSEPIPDQYPQWKDVLDKYTQEKKDELDTYNTEKKTELDEYKTTLETEMSTTKDTLVKEFNDTVESETTDFNNNAVAKVEEYNTNATNKVNEFNNNVDSIENELTELASQMPWNTTEIQDSIHVEDSAKYSRNKLGLFGNLEQEKFSGRNKIPTEWEYWESGHYDTNGLKTTYGSRCRLKELYPVLPSTTYYMNLNTSDSLGFSVMIRGFNSDKVFNENLGVIKNKSAFTTSDSTYYVAITIGHSDTATAIDYEPLFANGTIKPFMCLNSEIDKTFEIYTGGEATPNINYPSMPVVATGVQKIRRIGKNFLDLSQINKSGSQNGLDFIIENGKVTLNGTTTRRVDVYVFGYWNNVSKTQYYLPKGTYTLTVKSNVQSSSSKFTTLSYSGTTQLFSCGTTWAGTKTFDKGIYLGNLYFTIPEGRTFDNEVYEIQIEQGEISTDIQSGEKEIIELDLSTTELCKIVDENNNVVAQDRTVYKDGKWQWAKNVGKVVLDGTQTIETVATLDITTRVQYKNIVTNININTRANSSCNMLGYKVMWSEDKEGYYLDSATSGIILRIRKEFIGTTKESASEYFSNNNLVVYYPLLETTYEDCTAEQSEVLDKLYKLSLQRGTNNIYVESENGVTTELQLTYMQDLMSQINELKQAMLNIGGN